MEFYRRRLPHLYEVGRPVFLTWRLHGSVPKERGFSNENLTSAQAFVAMDRILDAEKTGPLSLKRPEIAEMVVESIWHHAVELNRYEVHAYTVMSNHVHALITPKTEPPLICKALKAYTARQANLLLSRTGTFWQEETYDRLVKNQNESNRIARYIEQNPVKAGLVSDALEHPWIAGPAVPRGAPLRLTRPSRVRV